MKLFALFYYVESFYLTKKLYTAVQWLWYLSWYWIIFIYIYSTIIFTLYFSVCQRISWYKILLFFAKILKYCFSNFFAILHFIKVSCPEILFFINKREMYMFYIDLFSTKCVFALISLDALSQLWNVMWLLGWIKTYSGYSSRNTFCFIL